MVALSVVVLLVILSFTCLWYTSVNGVDGLALRVVGLAFFVRVGFVLADHVLRIFAGSGDAAGYHATLTFVAHQWRAGILLAPFQLSGAPGYDGVFAITYSLLFAPIYTLLGTHPILIRLTMALAGALVVANLYLIGERIHSPRAGLYAASIAAVFPYWIQLSGILYRDMLIVLLFTTLFYGVLRWQQDRSERRAIAFSLVAGALAVGLRVQNVFVVAAALAVLLYLELDSTRLRLPIAVVTGLAISTLGNERWLQLSELASRRQWLSRSSGASYLTGFSYDTLPEVFAFAPIGALYFLLVPFPWQTPNTLAVIAVLQNVFFWYPVVVLSVLGLPIILANRTSRRLVLPLLVFALAGVMGYGLVEGNIGPSMRHRTQFQFVFVLLAGTTLAERLRVRLPALFDREATA